MLEAITPTSGNIVTLMVMIAVFVAGWFARAWYTRNPDVVAMVANKLSEDELKAMLADGKDEFTSAVAKVARILGKL